MCWTPIQMENERGKAYRSWKYGNKFKTWDSTWNNVRKCVCRKIIRYSVEGRQLESSQTEQDRRERIPDSKLDETEILWQFGEKKLKITLVATGRYQTRKYTWTRIHFEIVLSLFQCWRNQTKWKAVKKEQQIQLSI